MRRILLAVLALALLAGEHAFADETQGRLVRLAKLEIQAAHLDSYDPR